MEFYAQGLLIGYALTVLVIWACLVLAKRSHRRKVTRRFQARYPDLNVR